MPRYLVMVSYTVNMNREIEAASPDEAQEIAEREGVPKEDMAEVYDCLVFDGATAEVQDEL